MTRGDRSDASARDGGHHLLVANDWNREALRCILADIW